MENQNKDEVKPEKLSKSEKNIIYQKEYYKNNKNKLLKRATERTECKICGRCVSRYRINSHMNTKLCYTTQMNNQKVEDAKKQF